MLTLVQGFEPVGGMAVNPSELLVGHLAPRHDPDTVTAVLPVSLCEVPAER